MLWRVCVKLVPSLDHSFDSNWCHKTSPLLYALTNDDLEYRKILLPQNFSSPIIVQKMFKNNYCYSFQSYLVFVMDRQFEITVSCLTLLAIFSWPNEIFCTEFPYFFFIYSCMCICSFSSPCIICFFFCVLTFSYFFLISII